ncbi:hypothetical protein ACFX2F_004414 [Malus domestica]
MQSSDHQKLLLAESVLVGVVGRITIDIKRWDRSSKFSRYTIVRSRPRSDPPAELRRRASTTTCGNRACRLVSSPSASPTILSTPSPKNSECCWSSPVTPSSRTKCSTFLMFLAFSISPFSLVFHLIAVHFINSWCSTSPHSPFDIFSVGWFGQALDLNGSSNTSSGLENGLKNFTR